MKIGQSFQKKSEGNNGGGALQTLKVRFFYKIVGLTINFLMVSRQITVICFVL